ncbi:hypothetical protein Hanom_Chr07g00582171 [Helianthus anomalus]
MINTTLKLQTYSTVFIGSHTVHPLSIRRHFLSIYNSNHNGQFYSPKTPKINNINMSNEN